MRSAFGALVMLLVSCASFEKHDKPDGGEGKATCYEMCLRVSQSGCISTPAAFSLKACVDTCSSYAGLSGVETPVACIAHAKTCDEMRSCSVRYGRKPAAQ